MSVAEITYAFVCVTLCMQHHARAPGGITELTDHACVSGDLEYSYSSLTRARRVSHVIRYHSLSVV